MTEQSNAIPADSTQVLEWMKEGEARFLAQLDGLTDDELRADSALPDWSRAHVAAHVARNAEAVARLLTWARTGEPTSMYPDTETRNRDIELSARQEPEALRADVGRTSAQFDDDISTLPEQAWTARVQTMQGREIRASAVPWMRVREVWLHLVDLGSGVLVESWPGDLVDAVLDEVTATMSGREDAPSWLLRATDRDRDWQVGPGGGDLPQQEVSGTAANLLAWLTGRSTGEGLATEGVLPVPPHWM
ncbi:maleylpyruvate isomerase family mycothiol-dependent enzyme [soil metagenome]|jgi:maleylpyruvate isomerase